MAKCIADLVGFNRTVKGLLVNEPWYSEPCALVKKRIVEARYLYFSLLTTNISGLNLLSTMIIHTEQLDLVDHVAAINSQESRHGL